MSRGPTNLPYVMTIHVVVCNEIVNKEVTLLCNHLNSVVTININ